MPQDANHDVPAKKSLFKKVREFFFPPVGASRVQKILPYAVLGVVTLILLVGGTYTWDYTNSPVFCGTTCHTMPPEYSAYEVSPHARVSCVECHIGRGFVATRITRKAGDIKHVVKLAFKTYTYPIFADELRPARETCEQCHFPAKFSDNSLRQNIHYQDDQDNTRYAIYLAMRTGGGTQRQGLGQGIHWHIENEVWFAATDNLQQTIPYIRVVKSDGTQVTYTALNADQTPDELAALPEQRMDCITCHNRITHDILLPTESMDQALSRGQIDPTIPFIHQKGVEVLNASYDTQQAAHDGIASLDAFYQTEYPDFYAANHDAVTQAISAITSIYDRSVFIDQDVSWNTHPNNLGHENWPGCFRCHDGQHVSSAGQAIRLECNLCHSIPQVVDASVIEPELPLATGIEPDSHYSTHWIALHRTSFDQTCQACHTVTNPGGTDNSSFCSNSACHGENWRFAGLDAPELADILAAEQPAPPPAATAVPVGAGGPTFDGQIGAIFQQHCTTCHSQAIATGGLVLETYNATMIGGKDGPVVILGDAEASEVIKRQRSGHFAKLDDAELQLVIDWINNGAPEN